LSVDLYLNIFRANVFPVILSVTSLTSENVPLPSGLKKREREGEREEKKQREKVVCECEDIGNEQLGVFKLHHRNQAQRKLPRLCFHFIIIIKTRLPNGRNVWATGAGTAVPSATAALKKAE
jgi:hypothetical protein